MNACRSFYFGVVYLAFLLPVFGQVATDTSSVSPASISADSTLQTLLDAKQTLIEQQQSLRAQGATPAQMAAWRRQHAAQFAAIQQQADALASISFLRLHAENIQPNIPEGASSTLKDYLITQAALANARASMHNQLVKSLPANATQAQIQQAQQQAMQAFRQQHAADLRAQAQRAQMLAAESAASLSSVNQPARAAARLAPNSTQSASANQN